jgi:Zn-dependent peptidase ImmA (M78 family)
MPTTWAPTLSNLADDFYSKIVKGRNAEENRIKEKARFVLREFVERTGRPFSRHLPISPQKIATALCDLKFVERWEIPSDALFYGTSNKDSKIGGLINREKKEILIAQVFGPECARFTGAHEFAHWLLHPNIRYLRELPNRGEGANYSKPQVEREADQFAAELIMPTRHLVHVFFGRFGGPLPANDSHGQLSLLSRPLGNIDPYDFELMDNWNRAKVAAKSPVGKYQSLAKIYGVSVTAMATQLLRCGLLS